MRHFCTLPMYFTIEYDETTHCYYVIAVINGIRFYNSSKFFETELAANEHIKFLKGE